MLANKIEAKGMTKHVSGEFKSKCNDATFNSNQKWNNEICQCECENYHKCKNDYSWNAGKYLKEKRVLLIF